MHHLITKHIAHFFCLLFCFNTSVFATNIPRSDVSTDNQHDLQINVFTHMKSTNTRSFSYLNKERVSQIIIDAASWARSQNELIYQHTSDNIYWPAAGLFYTDSHKIDNQLSALLEQLSINQEGQKIPIKNAIIGLRSFLSTSLFKERIDIPIEPDYHDAGGKINPYLSGNYQLYLPSKSLHIWVVGAVENSTTLPFRTMTSVNDYLEKVQLVHNFGQSYVWIILPNGQSHKQGIAYWNKEDTFLLPGSIIFMPFKELSEQLNSGIVDLLKQRVMSS